MYRIITLHVALVCSFIPWIPIKQCKNKNCSIVHGKKFGTSVLRSRPIAASMVSLADSLGIRGYIIYKNNAMEPGSLKTIKIHKLC